MRNTALAFLIVSLVAGCEQDHAPAPSERETQLRAKASAGDAQALLELGWAYEFGDEDPNPAEEAKPYIISGIHKDEAQGAELIVESARKGNVTAMVLASNKYFFAHDFGKAADWAVRAADLGDPRGQEAVRTMVTIVMQDSMGAAYTADQRKAIYSGLKLALMNAKHMDENVLSDPQALVDAKTNSVAFLAKMCFGGRRDLFTVLQADAMFNDHERDNTSYPITTILEIRFHGPYGMLKRDATFACDAKGNVIAPLTLPEIAL